MLRVSLGRPSQANCRRDLLADVVVNNPVLLRASRCVEGPLMDPVLGSAIFGAAGGLAGFGFGSLWPRILQSTITKTLTPEGSGANVRAKQTKRAVVYATS